ncbi:MAG TPA: hypothetical protein VFR36_08710 [Sphingomicrobium sp.]|nr:hypothetical protein [Sphingomicrobium sp.]
MSTDDQLFSPDDPVYRYRVTLDHGWLRNHFVDRAEAIPLDAEFAVLGREKTSHRGIGQRRRLRTLVAGAVNQDFLDEICELKELHHLELGWPVTATDLSGLRQLQHLAVLKIDSPRNITDFTPILDLPALRSLFIENAKHLASLDWLVPLKGRLRSLGIEGSIWTVKALPSLKPLAGFGFEALFLTSVRLKDKDLTPLADCPNLKLLACARFAPKANFEALKALRPDIQCTWFEKYEI